MRRTLSLLLATALLFAQGDGAGAADLPTALRLQAEGQAHVEASLRAAHPALTRLDVRPVGSLPVIAPSARVSRIDAPVALRQRAAVQFVVNEGASARTVTLWYAVSAYRPAVVAARRVAARAGLAAADLTLRETDIAAAADQWVGSTEEAIGRMPLRQLAEGELIRRRDLAEAPLVRREGEVKVLVQAGSVQIAARGIAQQDGRRGDWVPVRNAGSGEVFKARVSGANEVRVGEGS